ncbi:MAG: molybdenum cofactor biosynthesis protein MoaE [Syntrophotaleaceae bacterium]
MVLVVEEAIQPGKIYDLLARNTAGSVLLHFAVVKETPHNQAATQGVEYRRNGDMETEMQTIAEHLLQQWELEDVLLIRRVGCLKSGEIISLVATSSPNSVDAFDACQHGISHLKKMSTIKKTEIGVC